MRRFKNKSIIDYYIKKYSLCINRNKYSNIVMKRFNKYKYYTEPVIFSINQFLRNNNTFNINYINNIQFVLRDSKDYIVLDLISTATNKIVSHIIIDSDINIYSDVKFKHIADTVSDFIFDPCIDTKINCADLYIKNFKFLENIDKNADNPSSNFYDIVSLMNTLIRHENLDKNNRVFITNITSQYSNYFGSDKYIEISAGIFVDGTTMYYTVDITPNLGIYYNYNDNKISSVANVCKESIENTKIYVENIFNSILFTINIKDILIKIHNEKINEGEKSMIGSETLNDKKYVEHVEVIEEEEIINKEETIKEDEDINSSEYIFKDNFLMLKFASSDKETFEILKTIFKIKLGINIKCIIIGKTEFTIGNPKVDLCLNINDNEKHLDRYEITSTCISSVYENYLMENTLAEFLEEFNLRNAINQILEIIK